MASLQKRRTLSYLHGKWQVYTGELSCKLWRSKSRWYWLVHELHVLGFWWGRESHRWELQMEDWKK